MKLNIRAAAATGAMVWGGAVLSVGIVNLLRPSYGGRFLRMVASVYPGYHYRRSAGEVAIGTGYALVDGAFGGAVCAWLYNRCVPEEASGEASSVQPPKRYPGTVSSVA
jgi:hypothetical protein